MTLRNIELGERFVREETLRDIFPNKLRQALDDGFIHVHGLGNFFGSAVEVPDIRAEIEGAANATSMMMRLLRSIKSSSLVTEEVSLVYADVDIGFALQRYGIAAIDMRDILTELFISISDMVPRVQLSLNLGGQVDAHSRAFTAAVFDVLSQGPTHLQPQVVFLVRRGINYNATDPNYDLLCQALEIARDRKGIAFS
ncbi:MAG: hypothetical protein Q8N36_02230, partial [bacterium]|nr:hypothetical protein [bacterium]